MALPIAVVVAAEAAIHLLLAAEAEAAIQLLALSAIPTATIFSCA